MCMDVRCQHLFAADNHGYVYHWDIKGYAMSVREVEAPPCIISIFNSRKNNLNICFLNQFKIFKWSNVGELIFKL